MISSTISTRPLWIVLGTLERRAHAFGLSVCASAGGKRKTPCATQAARCKRFVRPQQG